MKKLFFLLVFAAFFAVGTFAQEFTYNNLDFTINDDDVTVTLLGHVDGYAASGELNIPSVAYWYGNSYTVTKVDKYAFYRCQDLTSLIMPNTLIEIGECAFGYCGITGTVTIPASVEHVGTNPFYGCSSIESLVVESGNLNYDSRDYCNSIIYSADNELVSGCKNSTIPNTVTAIGEDAFSFCNSLTNVFIPSSINHFFENPFAGCENLAVINVDEGNSTFDSRNNCNAIINTSTNKLVAGCKNTIIPEGVVSIGKRAFSYCSNMTGELVIPNSVTTIDNFAFEHCDSLTGTLIIPNSVVYIGQLAFTFCIGFDSLILGESVTRIDGMAFSGCSGFHGSLVIPDSVESIGVGAFLGCNGLGDSLIIGTNVATIEDAAFNACSGIHNMVSLATTPPAIGNFLFGEAFSCNSLTVPCGCIDVYDNSPWGPNFATINEDCETVPDNADVKVSVYPNPTKGSVKIEEKDIQKISIYNIIGELLFESELSEDVFEYDFGEMDCGVYFISVKTNETVVTQRVIVKH